MKKTIALDYAVIGNDQPIDPTNRFHFGGLPQRLSTWTRRSSTCRSPASRARCRWWLRRRRCTRWRCPCMLQQTAQRAGLELDIKRMPADGYWSNHWLNSHVGFGNVNPRPSADVLLTQFFQSGAAWNESRWKSEKFDQLLLASRAETDLAKRKQMYADMQTMIHQDAGIGIPLFLASIDGHTSKLKGLSPIPLGGLMGYNFAENVWLEA
jgi:peptide/nickel transport system substrate-binding protein